jgi:hypothetical protein
LLHIPTDRPSPCVRKQLGPVSALLGPGEVAPHPSPLSFCCSRRSRSVSSWPSRQTRSCRLPPMRISDAHSYSTLPAISPCRWEPQRCRSTSRRAGRVLGGASSRTCAGGEGRSSAINRRCAAGSRVLSSCRSRRRGPSPHRRRRPRPVWCSSAFPVATA